MLATLIPLFDDKLNVCAYSLFSQKSNYLLEPRLIATGALEDATSISGMEVLADNDIDMLTAGNRVIVPVDAVALLTDFEKKYTGDFEKIILLIDGKVKIEEQFLIRIRQLKEEGFKLAMRDLKESDYRLYHSVLTSFDYFFIDIEKVEDLDSAVDFFRTMLPDLTLCASNVYSISQFESLVNRGGFSLYEGEFYRVPISEGNREMAPLKYNYIELLNLINDPDFDLSKAADVIGRDTALVLSLLEMANRLSINSEVTSIRHATAMLGQKEITHWINGYIAKELLADKPSEIMRLTLIRAKFAELIAPLFDLKMRSGELFLMGLFSLLDYMLDMPIKDALSQVNVSSDVRNALLLQEGPLAEILHFMELYENAAWNPLSRVMILNNIDVNGVYEAYVGAAKWYSSMFVDNKTE